MKQTYLIIALCLCAVLGRAQGNTPFITENFGSGTSTTMPTGWTTTVLSGTSASWKWIHKKSASYYALDTIKSTTAYNGWMILDADSIGNLMVPNGTINSVLTSPSYDCSAHPGVILTFQEYFRNWGDSCWVEVSNNNGATWTEFYPSTTAHLATTARTFNPDSVRINITQVAGNQANVKIRFHYNGTYFNNYYGYSWLVDDVALTDAYPVDVSISAATTLLNTTFTNQALPFTSIPLSLADTIVTGAILNNLGRAASPATKVVMTTTLNGAPFATNTQYLNLPVSAIDSNVNVPNMHVTSTGNYVTTYYADTTGDGNKTNNFDTALIFTVSDSLYCNLPKVYSGDGIAIHTPQTSSAAEISEKIGMQIYVPTGLFDTLTGVSVAFGPLTTPGVNISAYITAWDGSTWSVFNSLSAKQLTAADISQNINEPVYTYFAADQVAPNILTEGLYAVVFQGVSIGATQSAYILSGTTTTPVQYQSLPASISDTSLNDGIYDAPASGYAWNYSRAAAIRGHFGKFVALAVNNINKPSLHVNVYPNPAKDELHISCNLSVADDITVKLMDMTGKVVATKTISNVQANAKTEAVLNIAGLPNGAYCYTVNSGAVNQSGKVAVIH